MLQIPPDWGTFALLIVSFLVFWAIFKRLLFDPFMKMLAERERRIRGLSERTEQLLREGQSADEERDRQLIEVRREYLSKREAERRRVEEQTARIIEEARLASKDSVERVRMEIERQLAAAEKQLGQLGEDLAAELAQRVLGRKLE